MKRFLPRLAISYSNGHQYLSTFKNSKQTSSKSMSVSSLDLDMALQQAYKNIQSPMFIKQLILRMWNGTNMCHRVHTNHTNGNTQCTEQEHSTSSHHNILRLEFSFQLQHTLNEHQHQLHTQRQLKMKLTCREKKLQRDLTQRLYLPQLIEQEGNNQGEDNQNQCNHLEKT